jgi:hypothetical protein
VLAARPWLHRRRSWFTGFAAARKHTGLVMRRDDLDGVFVAGA